MHPILGNRTRLAVYVTAWVLSEETGEFVREPILEEEA